MFTAALLAATIQLAALPNAEAVKAAHLGCDTATSWTTPVSATHSLAICGDADGAVLGLAGSYVIECDCEPDYVGWGAEHEAACAAVVDAEARAMCLAE